MPSEFTTALRMPNGDYLAGGGGIGIGGGDCCALFVRIDRKGKVLWKRTLSPRSLAVSRMIVTSDGGIAAVGSISSNRIHSWRWVARLNAEGRVLWQKMFNKENGLAYHLTVLPDGDIISAGEMAADCACEGHQNTEPWAARVNGKGKVIWEKKLGAGLVYRGENPKSFAIFYADTLEPASENEFVLKGRTFEFARKEVKKETGSWTLRFDANGNVTAKSLKKFDNPKMVDGN